MCRYHFDCGSVACKMHRSANHEFRILCSERINIGCLHAGNMHDADCTLHTKHFIGRLGMGVSSGAIASHDMSSSILDDWKPKLPFAGHTHNCLRVGCFYKLSSKSRYGTTRYLFGTGGTAPKNAMPRNICFFSLVAARLISRIFPCTSDRICVEARSYKTD